jgi:MYXO-CTERM domain-containing protein
VTGCGCLILIGILVGGIVFMIFGSTDPGEPIAQAVAVVAFVLALASLRRRRVTFAPRRLAFVRARRA